MGKSIMTQKERRAESDSRIIKSAIRCFGEHGFTHSTLIDIARGAEVTSGLVAQRFESKENLYYTVCQKIVKEHFFIDDEHYEVPTCLIRMIDEIKELKSSDHEAFQFICKALNSSDIPGFSSKVKNELFEPSAINLSLKKAQERQAIPYGDRFNLFIAFMVHTCNQIQISDKYGIQCPEDEYFLRLIHIRNDEYERTLKQREAMLSAICQTFSTLTYIYVDTNKGERMRAPQILTPYSNSNDVRGMINEGIEAMIQTEYKADMKAFLDMDTLDERMADKKVIIRECYNVLGERELHMIIPVKRDGKKHILEVMAGIQVLE